MNKIITKDFINKDTKFWAVNDCTINGIHYIANSKITQDYMPLKLDFCCAYKMLKDNILSLCPTKAQRIEILKSFPGFEVGETHYIPFEFCSGDQFNKRGSINYMSHELWENGVRIHINTFAKYPEFFKIDVVDNPQMNRFEFICD